MPPHAKPLKKRSSAEFEDLSPAALVSARPAMPTTSSAYLEEHSLATVTLQNLPLLTPSLLVHPVLPTKALPIPDGVAIERSPLEAEPFARTWPNRPAPLPTPTFLQTLTNLYHQNYLSTFKTICSGASPAAAFALFGAVPRVIKSWVIKGSADLEEGVDSYYSRFALDMTRAVGVATQSAQMLVYADNPLKYLSESLGQSFGDEYSNPLKNAPMAAGEIATLPAPPQEMSHLRHIDAADTALQAQQQALRILAQHNYSPERLLQDHLFQHGDRTTTP